ncbi:hypothetical protein [Vibrio phage 2E1]|nr:hypothetical protein [Vibrio phage 2E1]
MHFHTLGFGCIFNLSKRQSLGAKMKFEIKPIKPVMSHKDKVYEYARRLSHYSLESARFKKLSKIFNCSMLDANYQICGERVGCSRRDNLLVIAQNKIGNYGFQSMMPKCQSCEEASINYLTFRNSKAKQATALRQLNKEMSK